MHVTKSFGSDDDDKAAGHVVFVVPLWGTLADEGDKQKYQNEHSPVAKDKMSTNSNLFF